MWLYILYAIISTIILPLFLLQLMIRLICGKEDKKRFYEKLAILHKAQKGVIWMHAASVGETRALLPLIRALLARGDKVLLTTITLSSSRIIMQENIKGLEHRFAPLDHPLFIWLFLHQWQPYLAIRIDSEIWPNTLAITAQRGVPMVLCNARLSDTSYKRWLIFKPLATFLYNKFSAIIPTSKDDAKKIASFTNVNIMKPVCNLKYIITQAKDLDIPLHNKTWLASSLHPGEYAHILAADKILRTVYHHQDLLTIIIPRHPNNISELLTLLAEYKLQYVQRSKKEDLTTNTQIYIADTLGEVTSFYHQVDIAFIGGSFVPIGGHNMIEAAAHNAAVIVGPYTHNFRDIVEEMLKHQALDVVQNATELAKICHTFFTDEAALNIKKTTAKHLANKQENILENIIEILDQNANNT